MGNSKVDTTAFRKKIIAHRARNILIVVGIVVALLSLVIVAFNAYNVRQYSGYDVVSQVERNNYSGSRVLGYGSRFITYSADGIHCTDAKGTDVWSFSYEMQTPMVEVNGDYVACAAYNGRQIYVFNESGNVGTIQLNVPVKRICVSNTGVVAAITDEGNITPITLYKYSGEKVVSFRTSMSKSGYPVALGISDNSKLVSISYLYMDSGVLTTKIAFYNFGEVGKNEVDNLVSGYDYQEEVVPVVKFLSSSNAFALGNNMLVFFEGNERPTSKANILLQEQVHAVFYGDNRVGLVYLNSTGESKYKMDIYTSNGVLENTLLFDMEYSDIFFANNKVFIYNATSGLIYDNKGRCKYDGDFTDSVSLIIPTAIDTKYVFVTADSIQTVTLK